MITKTITKRRASRKRLPIAPMGDWIVEIQPGFWISHIRRWPGTCTDSVHAKRYDTERDARNGLAQTRRTWAMPLTDARVYQVAEVRK